MMKQGSLVISLDFELMWGVRDKRTITSYGANILGVRKVIPGLLDLFHRYDVQATFATVGFLFARDKEELRHYIPSELPVYRADRYSPYANNYIDGIGKDEASDPYHYGYSLVQMIRQQPQHEIATHTFSHYYCLEGASIASFRADLDAATQIAAANDIKLHSIVFPRNQYSADHIEACRAAGLTAYRGNEKASLYTPRNNEKQSRVIRGAKLADAYVNVTGHHSFQPVRSNGMTNIPASRFLRPYKPATAFLDPLRLHRIRNSMEHAAKHGEGYHLWWHPHNFGLHLDENLRFLENIVQHYRMLRDRYGMLSETMQVMAAKNGGAHEI